MRNCAILTALVLVTTLSAFGQTDPLNGAYKPSLDCNPADYASNVSLTNDLAKLWQDHDTPTSISGYGTTPLPCLTIYGTQNQFVSFQGHVQAPSAGYAGITFTMSAMSKSTGPGGSYTIPAPATSGTGDNYIVVYREGYMHITTADGSHVQYNRTGWVPDGLFPAIDPYYHQATGAFPVAVAGTTCETLSVNCNQSAWVDVFVPPAAPSGWYTGTLTISDSSAGTIAVLPVDLGVWQWPSAEGGEMPSTATLHSFEATGEEDDFCSPGMTFTTTATCESTYPGGFTGNLNDLEAELLDDRVSMAYNAQLQGTVTAGTLTAVETSLMNGTAPTSGVVPILSGPKLQNSVLNAPGAFNAAAGVRWVNTFTTNGWFTTNNTENYLCDEPPNGCTWANLNSNATADRSKTTPIMPEMSTTDLSAATTNSALNSIDYMVVNVQDMEQGGVGGSTTSQRSTYNTWLSSTCCSGSGPARQVWMYVSCNDGCPGGTGGASYPNVFLDQLPIANRAEEWVNFIDNVSGDLYYSFTICWTKSQGCNNGPYKTPYSVGAPGDGNLLYPGTNSAHCSGCDGAFMNVSTPIWMPSIRLKLMRDGMQDYEYLHLLNSLGGSHATTVTNAISSWINNAYCFNAVATAGATVTDHSNFCPASGSVTFTGDLTDAYRALGADMHAISFPAGGGTVLPPMNLGISVAKNTGTHSASSHGMKK